MVSKSLKENMKLIDERIKDCDDIKCRKMKLGREEKVEACIYYVEVAINNLTIEETVIGKLINRLWNMEPAEQYEYIKDNALGITDVKELKDLDEVIMGIMIGDGVVLIDGYDKAIKIKSKGYPMMGVGESNMEKVMRGSREGFADALKANTALVRKRIRSDKFKVKEKIIGDLSNTTVAIAYVEGVARESVINEVNERLSNLNVEGLTDTGIIEQLTEESELSPFPQYQTTERPDKAAMEIINGRVALFVDNTPVALLLPTSYGSFFQTADDYYNRFQIVSFARMIRYVAAIIAMTFPAFYLAAITYHPEILPTSLVMTLQWARVNVPFPAFIEVVIMELAFELLREAGVRIPGPMGSTIGIVGGLIIGQAAVTAGVVSPIIVIVVAVTALASFAIPNDELASAFRILKYFSIVLAAFYGFFGIIVAALFVVGHLCRLKSFGFPYMMPYVASDVNKNRDLKDSIIRYPMRKMTWKSIYAKSKNRKGRY
ncbi:MAG: spore germination protein [Lachnospiraceae bacterium]|nr:spore germination protein [Lachnospiraceae bacterium]